MAIITVGGIREKPDMRISPYQYTHEEGMEIARQFVDEVLSSLGSEDFRLLAVIGSVSRGSDSCGDVDIAVAYNGDVMDINHPIHLKQEEYRKGGKRGWPPGPSQKRQKEP